MNVPTLPPAVPLKIARDIDHSERDEQLKLHEADWPKGVNLNRILGWNVSQGSDQTAPFPQRLIHIPQADRGKGDVAEGQILESMLRFPSAPIFSLEKQAPYYQDPLRRTNFHTFRLLQRSDPVDPRLPAGPVDRIYVIHNGLNECDVMGTYYRLAHNLFAHEERASGRTPSRSACLIRPLPAHLTRYPIKGDYAEKPMDRYLMDPTELFRQFLRFMLETQWLLSTLVPFNDYNLRVGLDLVRVDAPGGRANAALLGRQIHCEWKRVFQASLERLAAEDPTVVTHPEGSSRRSALGELVEESSIVRTIEQLRSLLGWKEARTTPKPSRGGGQPFLHAVGYSLGGFTAQSAFFTWPFAFASCTMLNSGGALGNIQLSGFANAEEWRQVLHAVRYGLDSAMVTGGLAIDAASQRVAGIEREYFRYFLATFYEVFLQDYETEYQSRVEEYGRRMLFVVGGHDPVVTPRSVIERSPESGINLIEVANLSHALHDQTPEWQEFWLPVVVSRVVYEFARRAEHNLSSTLNECWRDGAAVSEDYDSLITNLRADQAYRAQTPNSVRGIIDVPLTSAGMQQEANDIAVRLLNNRGWLIVARNQVPEEFLGPDFLEAVGVTMHHEERLVRDWDEARQRRFFIFRKQASRIFFVLPEGLPQELLREPLFPPYPRASRRFSDGFASREFFANSLSTWANGSKPQLLWFLPQRDLTRTSLDGKTQEQAERLDADVARALALAGQRAPVNMLPDVWVYLSDELRWVPEAGSERMAEAHRDSLLSYFIRFVGSFDGNPRSLNPATRTLLESFLSRGSIRLLKISRGSFNPRFRGYRVFRAEEAAKLLLHTALVLTRSSASPDPLKPLSAGEPGVEP